MSFRGTHKWGRPTKYLNTPRRDIFISNIVSTLTQNQILLEPLVTDIYKAKLRAFRPICTQWLG